VIDSFAWHHGGNAESAQEGLESNAMQTMQLQDGEVMIRHALHHIQKMG
jgi:hypothetical protein